MAATIVVVEILVTAATLDVVAKLFATALIPTTCSDLSFVEKCSYDNNFKFFTTKKVAAKSILSCSD